MSDFATVSYPKARYKHVCWCCALTIERRTRYARLFGVGDGVCNVLKMHIGCHWFWTRGNQILKSRGEEWIDVLDLRSELDDAHVRNLIRWAIDDTDLPKEEFGRIVMWLRCGVADERNQAAAFHKWIESEEGQGYRVRFRKLDREKRNLLIEIGSHFLPFQVTERHLLY